MICVTLSAYARACGQVSGGISDIGVFDPNDFNFTQAAAINGVAQTYTAIARRAGATGTGGTRASAAFTITLVGDDGDYITVWYHGIQLGTFTKTATESTATLLATAIAAAITSATGTNGGFTATAAGAIVTVLAPLAYGSAINGQYLVVEVYQLINIGNNTPFSAGVNGTNGKISNISFQIDEADWNWKQSVKGCSTKYEHTFGFQLPENSQALTTFLQALDNASCCCGLGMVVRLVNGKIFVCGEKYVNGNTITRFHVTQNGSAGGSGKLYDDFNGGNIVLTGSYSRNLYEYTGTWADITALM